MFRKIKDIIDKGSSPIDKIQWLDAVVFDASGELHKYWILHFPVAFPVINKDKSIMGDDKNCVVKPVLSRKEIEVHNIFGLPWRWLTWFVSKPLRDSIKAAGCTDIKFDRVQIDDE
jgi:hypothetical protein